MRLAAILPLALLALAGFSEASFYTKDSGVVNLDADNFDDVVNAAPSILVEFYAPWCGHCKSLKPAWSQAAKKLKGIVKVAAIDANDEKNRPVAGRYGIKGFPTIKIFKNGVPSDYNGGRDAKSIIDAGYASLTSYSKRITTKDSESFLSKNKDMPRAILITKASTTPMIWKALSTMFRDAMVFGEVKAKKEGALVDRFTKEYDGLSVPGILVFPENNSKPQVYTGAFKMPAIKTWLKTFAEIVDPDAYNLPQLHDNSCMQQHCASAALCAILVMPTDANVAKNKAVIQQVEEGRDDNLFKFSWIDSQQQKKFLKDAFGMDPVEYPQVVVMSPRKKRYSLLVGSFSAENIDRSLTRVLRGSIKTAPLSSGSLPQLAGNTKKCRNKPKPQYVPPKASPSKKKPSSTTSRDSKIGGSVKLTAQNFDALVLNSKSPWIVEFFAPWCGHCKQLAPHWKKAALKMRGLVKFGEVDATVEQQLAAKYGIRGYPTIKYFKEGLPKSPADYQGQRTTGALAGFAKSLMTSKYVKKVKQGDAKGWLEAGKASRMLLLTEKTSIPDLWRALSTEFQDDVEAGIVTKSDKSLAAKEFGVDTLPSIIVRNEGQLHKYVGTLNMPSISAWIQKTMGIELPSPEAAARKAKEAKQKQEEARRKQMEERKKVHSLTTNSQFEDLCAKGSTICAVSFIAKHATPEEVERTETTTQALAEKYAAKAASPYRFAVIDTRGGHATQKFINSFGVSEDLPMGLVAMAPKRSRYQVMVGVFDEEHITEFLDNLIRGKIKTASIKPFPTIGDGVKDEL